jgi:hypothetical protein
MEDKKISFVDSSNNKLFEIEDGGKIKIIHSDGKEIVEPCKYIDEYHTEIGNNSYHICQFAENMEKSGNKYEPIASQGRE